MERHHYPALCALRARSDCALNFSALSGLVRATVRAQFSALKKVTDYRIFLSFPGGEGEFEPELACTVCEVLCRADRFLAKTDTSISIQSGYRDIQFGLRLDLRASRKPKERGLSLLFSCRFD